MKLLKKSEITQKKEEERQREIAEGMKIAGRVDTLREVHAAEEASLDRFRRETIAAIQQDIVEKTSQRDSLSKEVFDLEDRKREAQKPLNEEWDKVHRERDSVEMQEQDLKGRERVIKLQEEELSRREKATGQAEERTRYTQEDADSRLRDADILKEAALKTELKANDLLRTVEATTSARIANVEQREQWVTDRERFASEKEEALRTQEHDLAKEYSRLRDREATLERSINRIKR